MNWIAQNSKRIVIAALIVFAVTGIALSIHSGSVLRYPDEREWTRLGMNLAAHHSFSFDGIHPTASRPPGYPLFLALPLLIGVGNLGLRLIHVALFLISAVLLSLLARRLYSNFVAAISVLLVICYPILLYVSTLLLPQTLGTTLLLLGFWLLVGIPEPSQWRIALSGFAFSLLILTIPTFLFVTAGFFAWLLWKCRGYRRRSLLFILPIFLVLGSWSVRNYMSFHAVFFVATNGGENLLLGNSENSTMISGSYTDISRYTAAATNMSEVDADRYYRIAAKHWIESHPAAAARLYLEKFVQFFSYKERTVTEDFATQAEQPTWRNLIMLLTYGPLLLLFLSRIVLSRRWPLSDVEILLIGMYFLSASTSAIFVPRIRYRLPMDWLLLLLAAGMIQRLFERFLTCSVDATGGTHPA